MIYGEDYDKLKMSYTGGAVDMYIPSNQEGELVYGYDVNSLYPYVMANYPMPVGKKFTLRVTYEKLNKMRSVFSTARLRHLIILNILFYRLT